MLTALFEPVSETNPLRMAAAETRPAGDASTTADLWRFGLNFRRLVPVIFLPTPPRYFACRDSLLIAKLASGR